MTLDLSAVVLPDRFPVSTFLDDVLAAERAGVRTVWTYDHLTWPLLADGPWFGAVPLLAADFVRHWDWGLFTFMNYGEPRGNQEWRKLCKVPDDRVYNPYPDDRYYKRLL